MSITFLSLLIACFSLQAHMPRGHRKHGKFAEFDVAAILNLMSSCKHFNIPGKYVTNVSILKCKYPVFFPSNSRFQHYIFLNLYICVKRYVL